MAARNVIDGRMRKKIGQTLNPESAFSRFLLEYETHNKHAARATAERTHLS